VTEAEAWDRGAEAWIERIRGDDLPVHPHDAALFELLPPPSGRTLDIGCGEGRLTRALRARGYEVAGYDQSERLVEEARRADPEGTYEAARADGLPVGDGAASLALCVNVLPHVVELGDVVRELARVLAVGGALVAGFVHPIAEAGTYDEEADELRVRRYFERAPHAVPLGEAEVFHQHRTVEDYLRAFLGAGFVLADLREVPGRTGQAPLYLDLLLRRGQ